MKLNLHKKMIFKKSWKENFEKNCQFCSWNFLETLLDSQFTLNFLHKKPEMCTLYQGEINYKLLLIISDSK